jgi:hypothetical protein
VTLKQIIHKGLERTSSLWHCVATAYEWVHQAAKILDNESGFDAHTVRRRFQGLIATMSRWKAKAGDLESGILHFLKVTKSYWSGLFHCYAVEGLPRTNNDLEHTFGCFRHHQRRCTGRKSPPPASVVRGSARLIAAVATKFKTFEAAQLASVKLESWRALRVQLEAHRQNRVEQLRFRRSPATYLAALEAQLLQLTLPP